MDKEKQNTATKRTLWLLFGAFLIVSLYVIFRPQKAELKDISYRFEEMGEYVTSEWTDTIQHRHLMRVETDTALNEHVMARFAEHARKYVSEPNFSVLFRKTGIGGDYARIDYPGGLIKELTGFEGGKTTR